jgi:N-acetylmuramoyl-L-alanine amidase
MPVEYEVQQGDSIASIAFEYGHHPDTIWNFPDNAKLKALRKDPYVLLPGDIVVIPDKRIVQYGRPTEQRHRFQRKSVPETLRVIFWARGQALRNKECTVKFAGSDQGIRTLSTDGEGMLTLPVPPNVREVTVTIAETGDTFDLSIGHLDPIDTNIGVKKRLRNIGLLPGDQFTDSNELDDDAAAAIAKFQADHDLPASGQLDDATRNKLKEVFEG